MRVLYRHDIVTGETQHKDPIDVEKEVNQGTNLASDKESRLVSPQEEAKGT